MKKIYSGSNLEKILKAGHFAVTAELGPPKGADAQVVLDKAALLKGEADAVNITDCQTAIVRMSSIAASILAKNKGIEPVVQMTCRDRNRIGIQSDLLGAWALGLKNLLCLTGDHQNFGNHPESKNVFDMDSIQLVQAVRAMRDKGVFINGEEIEGRPNFFIGAVENPFAEPYDYRAPRLMKKIEAGADFFQTQIVYNVDRFKEWMKEVRKLGGHKKAFILAGVAPLKSAGMAKYMKKFVPGMDVPEHWIERMEKAKDPKEEGINICVEIINEMKKIDGIAGVHVMAIEWEEAVPTILERANLSPRPMVN